MDIEKANTAPKQMAIMHKLEKLAKDKTASKKEIVEKVSDVIDTVNDLKMNNISIIPRLELFAEAMEEFVKNPPKNALMGSFMQEKLKTTRTMALNKTIRPF